ncbi:MAG: DUF1622 domain-containing protein [Phycisphaerales bacterium]|nr:MAG: DUF1622 domain-containing protein [Phycisphaerales bacterium]
MQTFIEITRRVNSSIAAFCQALAMVVIFVGVTKAAAIYFKDVFTRYRAKHAMRESRLEIGHSFSLALAFLIGASILNTTLAPSWNDIGQLAAIIGIRTGLNYFLMRDLKAEEQVAGRSGGAAR